MQIPTTTTTKTIEQHAARMRFPSLPSPHLVHTPLRRIDVRWFVEIKEVPRGNHGVRAGVSSI